MDRLNAFARRVPTWVIYTLGAVPLAFLVWGAVSNELGADPVKAIEHQLGLLGLQFLLASLAVTPLRLDLTDLPNLTRLAEALDG